MKNHGFVLMETIVVIVVISVALLTIFSSYNKILSKVKTENKYDTSEYIYMTYYIRKYLKELANTDSTIIVQDIYDNSKDSCYINNYIHRINNNIFGITKIYILKNLDNFDKNLTINLKNSECFDAYMIDYIRKIDIRNGDELIIVEYKRESKINGTINSLKEYGTNNILFETYIASLEW